MKKEEKEILILICICYYIFYYICCIFNYIFTKLNFVLHREKIEEVERRDIEEMKRKWRERRDKKIKIINIVKIIIIDVYIVSYFFIDERIRLIKKFGDKKIVEGIMNRRFWLGMTKDMLIESLG